VSASESAEITAALERAWESMGRTGVKAELVQVATSFAATHLHDYLAEQGWSTRAGIFLRRRGDNGLPQAPEVDEHGTHSDWALISVDECRFVIRRYMERSAANREQAVKVADYCAEVYGVRIDIDEPVARPA